MNKKVYAINLAAAFALGLMMTGGVSAEEEQERSREKTDPQQLIPGFFLSGDLGIVTDNNVFRTPDKQYKDYFADPAGGVIPTQNRQNGKYIPYNLSVGHEPKNFSRVEGLFKYTLTGKHYLDSKHENANQSDQEFSFGGVFRMGEKSKLESGLKVDVFWHKRNKLYIDRDTGEKKLTGAMDDISGKYTYTSVGLEAELFKQLSNNAEFGLGFNTEALDFEKPITGREYDNRFTEFFVKTDYRPFKYTKLKIDLSQASENYSDRRSRDLDGSMFGSYPTRVYNFQEIGFQVRQRVIQNLVTYADYSINNRKDEYLGYSNRSKSTMAVRVLYKFNEKLDSKFKFSYSNYDYPNALAYDKLISDPSSPSRIPLTYSSSQISGKLEYALKKNIAVVGELSVYNADSSDKRYDYERNEVTVGVNSHW